MAVAVAAVVAVAEVAGEPLRSARESGKFDAECLEGMANLDWWWGCLLLLSLGLNYHHLNSNDRQISLPELFYRFFQTCCCCGCCASMAAGTWATSCRGWTPGWTVYKPMSAPAAKYCT